MRPSPWLSSRGLVGEDSTAGEVLTLPGQQWWCLTIWGREQATSHNQLLRFHALQPIVPVASERPLSAGKAQTSPQFRGAVIPRNARRILIFARMETSLWKGPTSTRMEAEARKLGFLASLILHFLYYWGLFLVACDRPQDSYRFQMKRGFYWHIEPKIPEGRYRF